MTRTIVEDALRGARAVIFDWDGTLADTQERNYQALSAAVAPHQITIHPAWYTRHVGLPIRDLLLRLARDRPLPVDQIIETSRDNLLSTTTPGTITPIAAVVDLARQARRRGLPCAVASGAAAVLVEAGLHAVDLRSLFHAVVTRDDVIRGKPAPDAFLEAARQLGQDPKDCLAVDDSPDGITAAQRASMRVLAVRHGQLCWPNATTDGPGR